jgi:hypothetical protein
MILKICQIPVIHELLKIEKQFFHFLDRLAAKLARKDNLNVKLSQRPGKKLKDLLNS